MHILTQQELESWLKNNPEWFIENDEITTSHKFASFVDAFGFLSKLAIEMERINHHATITNTYSNVKISMNTHEAKNKITDRDISLAETIMKIKG